MDYKKINYKRIPKHKRIGDKLYVLEVIRDLDEAIDLICESLTQEEELDPFAEDLCPYFGVLWPSAEALGEFLGTHPELVKNKKVLELGCGLGLPSLVATYLGADVLATDFHPDVEEYFLRNCRHSSLKCHYQRLNWRESNADHAKYDVVMGSDILYESKHPKEVAQGLIRYVTSGGIILLADPGRNHLEKFISAMQAEGVESQSYNMKIGEQNISIFKFSL
jgi:predicted nicotinamide N-methyase